MPQRFAKRIFGLALALPCLALADTGLARLDADMVGPRSQVLVLGSVHLGQQPKGTVITQQQLDPLLDRLAAYAPNIIAVEGLSGETCDLMRRHATVYDPEDVKTYCPDTSKAAAATGLDTPAAIAEVRRQLKQWPSAPTAAQRRHLAATFLAAGDPTSAVVQWLQLPANERHPGDGLDEALVASLQKAESRPSESVQVAARLAVRLGLQRVYPIDDHTADNGDIDDAAAYGKAIQGAWDKAAPRAKAMNDEERDLVRKGDMLAVHRFINTPANERLRSESDFAAALKDDSPQHYGQRYVAGWDGRNLRMASNIRAASADYPGARVLVIVGATHKPWLDGLMGQMQGVEIVDALRVLGGGR